MHPSVESPGFSALLLAKADHAAVVKRVLVSHGFDVLYLANAVAASELSKHRRFDLAIYDEDVRGALELGDHSGASLHRVGIGLLAESRSNSAGARLHFTMRKPLNTDLLDKTVKAAFAPIAADRRASFRHDADIKEVSCVLHQFGKSRDLNGATVVNLSLTGLCIQANEMLPQSSRIELVFSLPSSYGEVHLFGEIIWSHSCGRSGVKFTSISPLHRHKLEDWADTMYRG